MICLFSVCFTDEDMIEQALYRIEFVKNQISLEDKFKKYNDIYTSYSLLHTITDGTEEDEKRLHNFFKEYREGGKNSCYHEISYTILDFFRTHTTHESLRELGVYYPSKFSKRNMEFLRRLMKPYIYSLISHLYSVKDPENHLDKIKELEEYLMFDLGVSFTEDDLEKLICEKFPEFKSIFPSTLEYWKNKLSLSPNDYGIPSNIWNYWIGDDYDILSRVKNFIEYQGKDLREKRKISYRISPRFNYFFNLALEIVCKYIKDLDPRNKYAMGGGTVEISFNKISKHIDKVDYISTIRAIWSRIVDSFEVGVNYKCDDINKKLKSIFFDENFLDYKTAYISLPSGTTLKYWCEEVKEIMIIDKDKDGGYTYYYSGFKILKI